MLKRSITEHYISSYEVTVGNKLHYGGYFRFLEDIRIQNLNIFEGMSSENNLIFVVRSNHVKIISPELLTWSQLYRCITHVGYKGRSSLQLVHRVGLPKNKDEIESVILEAVTTCVIMDVTTGKSAPIPDKMIQNVYFEGTDPKLFVRQNFPLFDQLDDSLSFTHQMKVGPSAIDSFGHVNQSIYLDWYDDVLFYASEEKSHPIWKYAKQAITSHSNAITIDYIREIKCGDVIDIKISPILNKTGTLVAMGFLISRDSIVCNKTIFHFNNMSKL